MRYDRGAGARAGCLRSAGGVALKAALLLFPPDMEGSVFAFDLHARTDRGHGIAERNGGRKGDRISIAISVRA